MVLCYRTLYKPGERDMVLFYRTLYKPDEPGHGAVLQDLIQTWGAGTCCCITGPYTNTVSRDMLLCYRTLYKPGELGHGAVLQDIIQTW